MTKKDFKNLIIIFIAIILLVGVLGCGKNNQTPITNNQDITNQEPEATSTPTATSTKTTCGENEQTIFLKDEEMDTSDWNTHRYEEYGFEIKYPDDYAFNRFIAIRPINIHPENPNDLDIQEWFRQKDWYKPRKEKIICLDAIKAITNDYGYDLSQYVPGAVVMIHFSYNKTIFQIHWYDGEQDDEETHLAYKQFLKMLETFKFDKK